MITKKDKKTKKFKVGRPLVFESPDELFNLACEYFEWVDANPFKKAIVYQGAVSNDTEKLQRPYTLNAFCIHAGMTEDTYRNYKKKEDFFEVTKTVDSIIYNQKFEGATFGVFNPNIIARDLGLADKREVEEKKTFSVDRKEELEKFLSDNGVDVKNL